jgi:hypothetical protein
MKKIITPAVFFCSFVGAYAQNYMPMPDSNFTWMVRHGNGEAWPTYYFYGMKNEDTVLAGQTYHKVFRSSDTAFDQSEYFAGLRQDVNTKRVYCYDHRIHGERILYDFSVQIGDTVRYLTGSSVDPFYAVQGVVYSFDSVNINGVYHRQIHFSMFGSTSVWPFGTWVEGVGNLTLGGFYKSVTALATCDCADKIVCLKQNGTWIYHNPEYSMVDCDVPTLGIQEEAPKTKLSLAPNPANSVITVRSPFTGNCQLTILNIYGAVVKKMNSTLPAIVDIKNLAPGMYRLELSDGKQMQTAKFIKE